MFQNHKFLLSFILKAAIGPLGHFHLAVLYLPLFQKLWPILFTADKATQQKTAIEFLTASDIFFAAE